MATLTDPDEKQSQDTSLSPDESAKFDQIAAGEENSSSKHDMSGFEDMFNKDAPIQRPGGPKISDDEPSSDDKSPADGPAAKKAKDPTQAASSGSDAANAIGAAAGAFGGAAGKFAQQAIKFGGSHRKGLAAGGGAGALVIMLMVAFLALLPLKLESLIKNFWNHEAARMEAYMERRGQIMVYKYLYQKVAQSAAPDKVYAGSNILQTLYGNMQKNKFEDKLLRDMGVKVEASGGNGIKFTMVDGRTFSANSAEELKKYMDTELVGKEASRALKKFTRAQTRWFQFNKRRMIRKYMINAYRISKWHIKKKEEASDPKKLLDTDTAKNIRNNQLEPGKALAIESVNCIFNGEGCNDPKERKNPDGTYKGHGIPDVKYSEDLEAKQREGTSSLRSGINNAYDQTLKLKGMATDLFLDAMVKIFNEAIVKLVTKAVPIIGWLALAADIDEFFWEGKLKLVAVHLHSAQYAASWATWASTSDQIKTGIITSSQVNVIMHMLENVERSHAVQDIYFKSKGGKRLAEDKRVGSDSEGVPNDSDLACDWDYGFKHHNDPPPISDGLFSYDFWTWNYRQAASQPPPGFHPPLCTFHGVIELINTILGWLFEHSIPGALLQAAMALMPNVPTWQALVDAALAALTWVTEIIWKPVVSGMETNEDLGNAIRGGATVVTNQSCRDVHGCKDISFKEATDQTNILVMERREMVKEDGLIASLLNTDIPEALGSRLLAAMPYTLESGATNSAATALAILENPIMSFKNFAAAFFPATIADSAVPLDQREPSGVQLSGYTFKEMGDIELHLPIEDIAGPPDDNGELTDPDGRVDQYDCPVVKASSEPNPCLIDVATAQAMCAGVTEEDNGGLGGNGEPGVCGDVDSPEEVPAEDGDEEESYNNLPGYSPGLGAVEQTFMWLKGFIPGMAN